MHRAVKSLALADDPALGFIKYEELYAGKPSTLAALGEWFGLSGLLLETFVKSGSKAMGDLKASAAAAIETGPGAGPRSETIKGCDRAGASLKEKAAAGAPRRPVWCEMVDEPALMKPGIWRRFFGPSNVIHFKGVHGKLLQQLGYESSDDWTV